MSDVAVQPKVAVVIEDDPDVRSLLDAVFRSAGFQVVLTGSGPDGIAAVMEHEPTITTVDVNLPGIDGIEVVRRIRKSSSSFIMMLSALAEETDVVLGLSSGADDYVIKPFRPRELRARIEALMRRPRIDPPEPSETVNTGPVRTPARNPTATAAIPTIDAGSLERWESHRDISLNLATHTALVAQREVELTPTEFDLLATLLESKRRVRSKADLALVLRGEAFGSTSYYVGEPDKRAIEAHMANLRRKIGDNSVEPRYIETVRGVGYRLTPAEVPAVV
ncbi:response regulator transcription factor [Microbacterium aerolatum]|uniref:response regulator transcription factor n=1 Tax=Microbacterium aerolatum TaxID=153731 RepID=UPI003850D589